MIFRCPDFAHEIILGDPPEPGEAVHLPWLDCAGACEEGHFAVVLEVKHDFSGGGAVTLVALSMLGQPPGLPIREERFTTYWSNRP